MNFLFGQRRALCIAENATHNMHNVLTPRGALVRDAHVWARYLDDAIEMFCEDADVVFAGHHWPRWGRERIVDFLAKQRDLYGYIHDQTLRLLNKGLLPAEIAETLELPPGLEREWHCRGYYGSLSHNVKAVYQRYLGWFDGNPAHLWPHPPQAAGERYVALAGGAEQLLQSARRAYRRRATSAGWRSSSITSCSPTPTTPRRRSCRRARSSSSRFGAENATWRNFFLMGALELRQGVTGSAATLAPDVLGGLSTSQLLDAIAVQIDGPRAGETKLAMRWSLPDTGEEFLAGARERRAQAPRGRPPQEQVQATVTIERSALDELILGRATPEELLGSGRLKVERRRRGAGQLLSLVDPPDRGFAIVTPRTAAGAGGAERAWRRRSAEGGGGARARARRSPAPGPRSCP